MLGQISREAASRPVQVLRSKFCAPEDCKTIAVDRILRLPEIMRQFLSIQYFLPANKLSATVRSFLLPKACNHHAVSREARMTDIFFSDSALPPQPRSILVFEWGRIKLIQEEVRLRGCCFNIMAFRHLPTFLTVSARPYKGKRHAGQYDKGNL